MVVESKKNIVLLPIKPKYAHAILAGEKFTVIYVSEEMTDLLSQIGKN